MLFLEADEGSMDERADNGAKTRCKPSSRPAIISCSILHPPQEIMTASFTVRYITIPAQLSM
ncbi:hypothetical protein V8C35DRAFT_313400 [Trichoderma chlorosporum]